MGRWPRLHSVLSRASVPLLPQVYHVPPKGVEALSAPILPEGKDAAEVMPRLQARHDDSEDNVRARLALWDEHLPALRTAYADVSLRLLADAALDEPFAEAVGFCTLEAQKPDVDVLVSSKLTQLQYEIIDTMRCAPASGLHAGHKSRQGMYNTRQAAPQCHNR